MKKINVKVLLIAALFVFAGLNTQAQNYDAVSGATQSDAPVMTKAELVKALQTKGKLTLLSTVNADGTPNAAVYGVRSINENIVMCNASDKKTTKINLKKSKYAIMTLILKEKTTEGKGGAKVVLKYIDNKEKIKKLKEKLEKSSDATTFFKIEKIMAY